jgi:uncharacterized coiled-coil protein SlyX
MFGKILKGLAVAAGVGFAVGMAAGKHRQPREDRAGGNSPDRLSSLEQRVQVIQMGLADVTKGIPAMLESIVAPRVEDLRLHLRSEAQQSIAASLTRFERAFEDKVSDRIAALEKVVLDQSALMTALSQRAVESEMNMERLISAVGRLRDQTGESPDPPLRNHVNGDAASSRVPSALRPSGDVTA